MCKEVQHGKDAKDIISAVQYSVLYKTLHCTDVDQVKAALKYYIKA